MESEVEGKGEETAAAIDHGQQGEEGGRCTDSGDADNGVRWCCLW